LSASRPPTSLAITTCVLVLGLGCATGAEDLDGTSTFASFSTVNDEVDTTDEAMDTGSETATTGDGDGDPTTSTTTTGDGDGDPSTTTTDESTTGMPEPCGNGMIDPGEDCDGIDLGGETCMSQGFDLGTLTCADDCSFDIGACEAIMEFCGDGIVNNGEQCEPGMLGNATCASAGFVYGTLACNAGTCMYDTAACQNVWIEDFEDGVVPPGWSSGGNANWSVTSADKHAGSWGGKAGTITDSQTTWAQVTTQFPAAGSVSFWHKISSESGWDYGRFLIDGVQQNQWSGAGVWTQYSVNVGAGQHTLRWSYEKDGSLSSNSDTWYVDDVTLTGGYVP